MRTEPKFKLMIINLTNVSDTSSEEKFITSYQEEFNPSEASLIHMEYIDDALHDYIKVNYPECKSSAIMLLSDQAKSDNSEGTVLFEIVDVWTDYTKSQAEFNKWVITKQMEFLADYYGYEKSPNFYKIVNARANMRLPWNQCPCGGDKRGCISSLCHSEIESDGKCHCNCFLRRSYES